MKKKIELGTVIFIVIVAVVLSCFGMYMYLTSLMPSLVATEAQYDRIVEADKTILKHYIGEVDEKAAIDSLILGLVSGVDKYGTYFDEESYAKYISEMNGKHSGVGITVKYVSNTGLLKIIDISANSPADTAKLKVGDLIYKIDDVLVSNVSYDEALSLLKAENGTEIKVVVLRDDREIEKTITVAEYLTSSVKSKVLYNDVGYVSITEFDNTTYNDFKNSVKKLIDGGAKQFIFDVRNNRGGSLSAVVNTLDYILPEGTLATLEDKSGDKKTYASDISSLDKPFVVLINDSTYSGGELFAAAVRDFKAGKLIGETTYGKGYAQELIPLKEGALYLSTKLYYPPSGVNYEGIGVSPDIEILLTPDLEDRFYELSAEEDLQMAAALKELGKTVNNDVLQ